MYALPASPGPKPEPRLPALKTATDKQTDAQKSSALPAVTPTPGGNSLSSGPTTAEKLLAQPSALDTALQQQNLSAVAAPQGLRVGDRGAAVVDLQQKLNQHGHNPGTIDGIFGGKTQSALESFQSDAVESLRQSIVAAPPAARNTLSVQLNRLQQEISGEVAGPQTLLRLNRTPITDSPATTAANGIDELGPGSKGPDVGQLQQQLKDLGYTQVGAVDNSFGPNTLAALKSFQTDQIELLETKLDDVPPTTRSSIQAQINELKQENTNDVAGTQTRKLLDDPLNAASAEEESFTDILIDAIPDYSRRSEAQKQALLESVDTLANGNSDEKLSAALALAGNLDQHQLRNIALKLEVTDLRVTRLATNTKAFAAAAVLADPDAADSEKLIATGELFQALGSTATGRTADVLKPWLQGVKGATSVLQAWETWNDPEASAADKASAIVDAVSNVTKTAALLPADAARILGNSGNAFKIATAAVTLFDPEASTADKALAVAQIVDAATGLPGDYDSIRKILDGHVEPNQLNRIFDNLPAKHKLPSAIYASLDPKVLDQLTHADADGLIKIGRELVESSGDESAEVLGRVLGKLDYDGVKDFTTFSKQLDGRALELFLKTADQINPTVLRSTLDVLKTADGTVVKTLSKVLDFTARALDALGVKVTREVAEKLAKSFGKALPVAGAVFAGYDAFQLGRKAFDTNLPDDLRYLAATGAKVNLGDAAYSIFEPLIAGATGGLGVAPDIALAGTSLAIDLVLAHEEGKLAEQGGNYAAPDWIGHTNVAVALGTNDLQGFYQIYGISDGNAQITETLAAGGDAAIEGAQALIGLAGSGFEQAQELTQQLLEQGGPAAQRLIDAISIVPLGDGFDAVLEGLADAGAAGKDALESLASAGVDKARDFLNGLLDVLNPFS